MDRELSPEFIFKRRSRKIIIAVIAVILIVIFFMAFRRVLKPTIKRTELRTAIAEKGSIEATITASGIVVPEYEQVITSPIQASILAVIHPAGSPIKPGQSILELDKEAFSRKLDKLHDEYALKINQKKQKQLNLKKTLIDLQTQLEIKKMEVKLIESELIQTRKIFKLGGISKSELEQNEMKHQIALKEVGRLTQQIRNQNESTKTELTALDLEIEIQKKNYEELQRQLELAEITAERAGVVTWVNDEIGAVVNPGDAIVRIADLSSFKIKGSISDIYADRIQPGSPVKVQLGDSLFFGQINQIQPQIEDGTLTFFVKLAEKNNPGLRSNLRVDVHVITSFKPNVIRVRNGPFTRQISDGKIFLLQGDKAIRRDAKIGVANFDFVEIENGINAGEVVIISDMSDYVEMKEIEVDN